MAVITPDDDLLAFVIASKKENNIIKQDFIFGCQKFVRFAGILLSSIFKLFEYLKFES